MGALCAFLLVACYYDYRYRKIPNFLLGSIFIAELLGCFLQPGRSPVCFLTGTLLVMLFLYPLFKLGVLGAGDVKLLGICGGYFAFGRILSFLFFALLFGAVFSLGKMLLERSVKERFLYLGDYLLGVIRKRTWFLYLENQRDRYKAGIPLAGPALCSVLLCMGGVY